MQVAQVRSELTAALTGYLDLGVGIKDSDAWVVDENHRGGTHETDQSSLQLNWSPPKFPE